MAGGGVGEGVRLDGGGCSPEVEDDVCEIGGSTSVTDWLAEGVRVVGVVEWFTDSVSTFEPGLSVADWLRATETGSRSEVWEGDAVADMYGLSGRERVDVDLESMSALGRLSFT